MACTETFATLRVFSEVMHPDEIGNALGIRSTDSVPRDPGSKYKPRRKLNFWSRTTKDDIDATNNVEHLEFLLSLVSDKEAILSNLREKGCSTDIFCYWDSTGQGGPILSVGMMKELVRLGLGISWDIYFDDEGDVLQSAQEPMREKRARPVLARR